MNLFESLPLALKHLRKSPGQSGNSPYHFLGRDPLLPGLLVPPISECPDATTFIENIQKLDKKVAEILNGIHAKNFGAPNKIRKKPRTPKPQNPKSLILMKLTNNYSKLKKN